MSLRAELKNLFSPNTIRQASRLKPGRVDALAVNEAAGALLRLRGKPADQVTLVRAMNPTTAAALCRWLSDPSFWGSVGGISKH